MSSQAGYYRPVKSVGHLTIKWTDLCTSYIGQLTAVWGRQRALASSTHCRHNGQFRKHWSQLCNLQGLHYAPLFLLMHPCRKKKKTSAFSHISSLPVPRALSSNLLSLPVKRDSESSARITLPQLDPRAETNWKSWPHHCFSFDLLGLCRRSHMSCLRSLTRRWWGTTALKDSASTCSRSWPTSWASRTRSAWCLMGNTAPRTRRASGTAWSGSS